MDDDVETGSLCDLEMTAEEVALAGVVVFVGPAVWSGMEVVETGLANRGDFWIGEVGAEEGFEFVVCFVDIARVDANAGGDTGVVVRDLKIDGEIGLVRGERDHAVNAILRGARDDVGNFFG